MAFVLDTNIFNSQLNNGKTINLSTNGQGKCGAVIADYLCKLPTLIVISDTTLVELSSKEEEEIILSAIVDLPDYVKAYSQKINGICRLGLFPFELIETMESFEYFS